MRWFKWLFKIFGLVLLALIIIVLVRTFNLKSKQIAPFSIEKKALRSDAVYTLMESVQMATVSNKHWVDTAALLDFDTLLMEQFVLVDSLIEKIPINRYSSIYHWKGKNPELLPILCLAHKDVVPVGKVDLEHWTHPPFSGKNDGEFIWGRGTLDDKVSILGLMEAAEMLLKEDFIPERSIYFAFGHDEEIGGLNGAVAMSNYFETKGIKFEYILDEGMVILENALKGLEKPVALIGVAEKGYATFDLKVSLPEGGHSSMPPKETAIGILAKALECIRLNPFDTHLDGAPLEMLNYLGPEFEFLNKLGVANLWLTEPLIKKQMQEKPSTNAIVRTTVAPTIIQAGIKENVLPAIATATINTRIRPGESIQSTMDYLTKVIDNDKIEIALSENSPATEPPSLSRSSSFGFNVIQKTAQSVFPHTVVAPSLVIATTDSRYYTHLTNDVYRFLPVQLNHDDLSRIHGYDERISIKGYGDLIHFYYFLLLNSAG